MSDQPAPRPSTLRARWAAIGAVLAISLGAGSIGVANAIQSTGERSTYTAIPACRVADTRANPEFNTGPKNTPLGAGQTMSVKVTGNNGDCSGIPNDITGVSLNVTVLHATHDTHITIWDQGPVPDASSLNPAPGQPPVPNAVTTKVAGDGTFKVFNFQGSVNVIVDIVGFHRDHNHDDRYYTENEIDATSKWISIDPYAMSIRNGATRAVGHASGSGIVLPPAGVPGFEFGFTLPPDYTPGNPVNIFVYWRIDQTACALDLRTNFISMNRRGATSTTAGFSLAAADLVPPTPEQVSLSRFKLDPSSSYGPGTSVMLGFFRFNTGDSCNSGDLKITGVQVTYT